MNQILGTALVCFFAAPVAMMLIGKESASRILARDKAGYILAGLGLAAIVAGVTFRNEGLAAIGGFLFGLGVLIALPDNWLPGLLARKNLGLALLVFGLYFFSLTFWPIRSIFLTFGRSVWWAFDGLMHSVEWVQIWSFALAGSIMVVGLGIFILGRRR